jgi:ketosteroid isomerase-like protein
MITTDQGGSTEQVLARHWRDFVAGDLESIMSDYAQDALLVSAMGTLKGHAQIRPMFESIFSHLFPPGTSTLKLEKQSIEGELGFIIWSGSAPKYEVPFATDTLWIRDGKISVQTFAANMIKK